MPNIFKILPKWRNFTKSGHTGPEPRQAASYSQRNHFSFFIPLNIFVCLYFCFVAICLSGSFYFWLNTSMSVCQPVFYYFYFYLFFVPVYSFLHLGVTTFVSTFIFFFCLTLSPLSSCLFVFVPISTSTFLVI